MGKSGSSLVLGLLFQMGFVCQSYGATERFSGSVPAKEASRNRDQQSCEERRAS